MSDELYHMAQQAASDSRVWFPDTAHSAFFMAACIAGEAGELLNEMKKVERGSHELDDVVHRIKGEMADVFTYLLSLAGLLEVDLQAEYEKKRELNKSRFAFQQLAPFRSGDIA